MADNEKKPTKRGGTTAGRKATGQNTPTSTRRAPAPRPVEQAPQPQYVPQPVQQHAAPPQPETFIVQNITKGPLYISDIGMSFGPLEVRDLTWEDPYIVKRSNDLRKAILSGFLARISQEQWNQILAFQVAQAQADARRIERNRQRTRQVQADGRVFDAEIQNLSKADGGRAAQEAVATAGYINDPVSYSTAFREAILQYEDRGFTLDAHTFAALAQSNPDIIGKLLNGESIFSDMGAVSGDPNRGRATVLTAPTNIGEGMGVMQMPMTNYNRDQQIAGSSAHNISSFKHDTEGYLNPLNPHVMPNMHHTVKDMVDLDNLNDDDYGDDAGYAEEIDLANDLGDNQGGGIRRL